MIQFYYPTSRGEWLAFAAALTTVGIGFYRLVVIILSRGGSESSARAQLAGMQLGVGATAILMAQPLIYLALGAGWTMAVLAQAAALARGGGRNGAAWAMLALAVPLAALPVGYAFGAF